MRFPVTYLLVHTFIYFKIIILVRLKVDRGLHMTAELLYNLGTSVIALYFP